MIPRKHYIHYPPEDRKTNVALSRKKRKCKNQNRPILLKTVKCNPGISCKKQIAKKPRLSNPYKDRTMKSRSTPKSNDDQKNR